MKELKNKNIWLIKKSGAYERWNPKKIDVAISKSAERACYDLSAEEKEAIIDNVIDRINLANKDKYPINIIHNYVETALNQIAPMVAKSYMDYRNYKQDFARMMDGINQKANTIMFRGDKENSNADSALVSTKRCLIFNQFNKELYKKFFLTEEEIKAINEGYIYVHDMSARRDTMNCFDRSTRFITDRGVKSFYDFCEGEEIKVLTHKGNWKKAIVKSYGYQPLQKVTFKRAKGNPKEVLCTANHRWILKDGSETTNLKVGDKLISAPDITAINWDTSNKTEKLLWCLGFGIGDGSIINDNNIPTMLIRLCGHKIKFAERFEDMGYTVTYPDSLNGDGFVRMPNIHSKEIPWLILNNENVKFLIDGLLSADGNIGLCKNNKYRGLQVTGDANNYIYDLLNMSGYYVTNMSDLTGQKTNYGIRTSKTISYGFHSTQADRTWVVENIEPAYLNGNAQVWCLEVEDDHSFILENGIPTGNCCLFDIKTVLTGGFEMGNIWYNEPKSLDVAGDVIGDIVLSAASQQYGGFTIPEIDKVLAPYAEKSYNTYYHEEIEKLSEQLNNDMDSLRESLIEIISDTESLDQIIEAKKNQSLEEIRVKADEIAFAKVTKEMEQVAQGWEYKFNTVASSRGDYPFTTLTFGLGTGRFEKLASISILKVRAGGQGKKGHKVPVLFPKLVFLYDENLHGPGKELEDVFEAGVYCSSKAMYPDWLSLTGEGYVPSIYKEYGKVISPMGCRAFLSPWWKKGGMYKADETDEPIFVGRFNIGAISLHLPMILAKARDESKDFYEVLDIYLEMIRKIHLRTYAYLGEMKASCNPLAYCEGGFLGGHLNPGDKIAPLLDSATASFGITALNELQQLYNKKSLVEDGQFALEVMQHIADKIEEFKKKDGRLYAIYGTPAENLCGLQVRQFRDKYGIVENVSDRTYVSNSFHCHVSEDITPTEKQDLEERFWNHFNGGKIQYVKYPIGYNSSAIRTLIRRAMYMGFYEGVNMALSYCNDCGHEELDMDVCPVCGSKDLTKIDRMNGYLSYSRVKGDSRLADHKMDEIRDRKSM